MQRHRQLFSQYWPSALLALFLAAGTVACDGKRGPKNIRTVTINNAEPRRDVTGEIIDAHDGCLQFFNGIGYLYGTAYGTNDGYTTANRSRVYRSPDLEHWTLAGELFKAPPAGIYYRPYVVFNPRTRKYVLWYNWYPQLWDGQVGVAVSDTPVGPFTIVNPNVHLFGSDSRLGDGSLFVDDDGAGYYAYTVIGGGYTIRVTRLKPDFLGVTGETSGVLATGCEAPLLFRRNDQYYLLTDAVCPFCTNGSGAQVMTASAPLGPYALRSNINRQSEKGEPIIPAQGTWVAKIPTPGEPAYIWMADRWGSAPDGIKGHDFQYWSAPLKFGPEGDIMPIENMARWETPWGPGD